MITEKVGKSIKTIRTIRGMTLAELAEEANTSVAYLSQLENGKHRNTGVLKLNDVCRALGIPFYLMMFMSEGDEALSERTQAELSNKFFRAMVG